MAIPANAKLQVHPDGRIFYRGADLTGVAVTPDEALAHLGDQRLRFVMGDVEYDRVLAVARAAIQQSGKPQPQADAPASPRRQSAGGDDRVSREGVLESARRLTGELGQRRAALADAHRSLVESGTAILGGRARSEVAAKEAAAPAAPASKTVVDPSDPFASPPNAATALNAKREVLHVIDVP